MSRILFLVFMVSTMLYGTDYTLKTSHQVQSDELENIDINQLTLWFSNNGLFTGPQELDFKSLEYPSSSNKTLIFSAGLNICGKVDGEIRTAAAYYSSEFSPGSIMTEGPAPPDDPSRKIYKISKYDTDFSNWPIQLGAPADANSGNPLFMGDQQAWFVFNDADREKHKNVNNTDPLNLEIQALVWGFDTDGAMGNTIFLRYYLINKGSAVITDAHTGLFTDGDLGYAGDDYVGCDSSLALGYYYNGQDVDKIYFKPPAFGFQLLKSPVAAGKEIGLTAFAGFA